MPSIRDFSGGVVNQELQNKDNGNGILFDCKNVLSSCNGELRKRTGTDWLLNLSEYQRVIPYRMPDGNDIMLIAGTGGIAGYKFISDTEIVPVYTYSDDAPEFPTSGWGTSTTNGDWTIALSSNSATTTWGKGFDTPTPAKPMKYYNKGALWTGGYGSETNTTADIIISNTDPQCFSSAVVRWTNTVKTNTEDLYRGWVEPYIQYSDDGSTWTSVATTSTVPDGYVGSGAYYQAKYTYSGESIFDRYTENYTIMKITNEGDISSHRYWRIHFARRLNAQYSTRLDLNVSDITFVPTTATAFTATNSFFDNEKIDKIKYAQNDNLMILTNGVNKPLQISYASGVFTVKTHVNSLDDSEGIPSCVSFYQNRLWFGGFTAFPTRVWGSAFGNFADFTIPTTVLATSPISADSVEIQSIIENMWGGNNALYCLSEDGISMIDAQGGIVATDQIEFKLRNREPANSMTPTSKDDIMIYLGRDRKKIFITDFDFVVQRFRAQNISLNYNSFFGSGIKELHYIPNKASLIYGLLTNGKAIALLFSSDQSKNAIYPIEIDGRIDDIEPIKYGDLTQLVMVTNRGGSFYLERKKPQEDYERMDFMTEQEKKEYTESVITSGSYTDFTYTKKSEFPIDIVEDLPFTSDKPVFVIADGKIVGYKEVQKAISGDLYAWKYNDLVLYTDTETPTTSDLIYDYQGNTLADCTITAVGDTDLTINYYLKSPEKQKYTKWQYTTSVTTSDGTTHNRSVATDGYHSTRGGKVIYGFGFGSYYTYRSTFSDLTKTSSSYKFLYTGAWAITDSTAQHIDSWNSTNYFVKGDQLPEVGDKVYDELDNEVGTITNVGYDFSSQGSGLRYYYIEFNGLKVYAYDAMNEETRLWEELCIVEKDIIISGTDDFERYEDGDIEPTSTRLVLEEPANEIIMGYPYDSYAVLKFVSPYNMRKFPKEISVNFINSGYLELGNTFASLKPVLNNLAESVIVSSEPVLLNGNYTKTFDKKAFETPYVIVRSNYGLPFIITGIDYRVDMSNYQGGV